MTSTKTKSKSNTNIVAGKNLQRLRIQHGILEQKILADALGWRENKVRDREIAVASISMDDLLRLSMAFKMAPEKMAEELIRPICMDKNNRIVVNKVEIKDKGFIVSTRNAKTTRKWAYVVKEDTWGQFCPSEEDFGKAVSYYEDTISDIRSDVQYEMSQDNFEKLELEDISHIPENPRNDWSKEHRRIQGLNLQALRLSKGHAAQWQAASLFGYNPSWIQGRESGKISTKLDDIIWMGSGWGMNPVDIAEKILCKTAPDKEELRAVRKKCC